MRKILFLLLMMPAVSNASNFFCQGKVSVLAVGPTNGILQVNTGHGVHYVCKLHEEKNGVHPEVCKAWYSMYLSAMVSGKEISQGYSQIDGGAQDCASLGSWVTPNPIPYWVQIKE